MAKVFTVLGKVLEELGARGVRDVHARLAARVLPPEKEGAEERALEVAREGVEELHKRGLEKIAAGFAAALGDEAPKSARRAGSAQAHEHAKPNENPATAIAPAAAPPVPSVPSVPAADAGVAREVNLAEGASVADATKAQPGKGKGRSKK